MYIKMIITLVQTKSDVDVLENECIDFQDDISQALEQFFDKLLKIAK